MDSEISAAATSQPVRGSGAERIDRGARARARSDRSTAMPVLQDEISCQSEEYASTAICKRRAWIDRRWRRLAARLHFKCKKSKESIQERNQELRIKAARAE